MAVAQKPKEVWSQIIWQKDHLYIERSSVCLDVCQSFMSHPNHDQGPKPQSRTSRVIHNLNQDIKDIKVLCTFKFNVESWILKLRLFETLLSHSHDDKELKPLSGTSRVLHNSNQDFEDLRILCTFKFNEEIWNSEHRTFGTLLTDLHHDQGPQAPKKL